MHTRSNADLQEDTGASYVMIKKGRDALGLVEGVDFRSGGRGVPVMYTDEAYERLHQHLLDERMKRKPPVPVPTSVELANGIEEHKVFRLCMNPTWVLLKVDGRTEKCRVPNNRYMHMGQMIKARKVGDHYEMLRSRV